ncbi:hypothetical protein BDV93DRAFT_521944 [Ceratobasidium sp. AG-I]|nr:hypothetical protein BDV93DRAFT_521944 [Ceratobasidium sp. AG-I]
MAPTFTIFQDPPCPTSSRRTPSVTTFTSASSSTRSFGRPASSSTPMLAQDADKENVDPVTGLPRGAAAKSKSKKALSSKTKDNSSKTLTKAPKASRGGSPTPAKPAKTVRTSPYPDSVPSLPVSELSFQRTSASQPTTLSLITGFSASNLGDFCEPEFELPSDFVDQPSPPRSRFAIGSDSLWSEAPPSPELETEGDRRSRDLTELPLADLSEAFNAGAKMSTRQNKVTVSTKRKFPPFNGPSTCFSSGFQTTPMLERQHALIVDVASRTGSF